MKSPKVIGHEWDKLTPDIKASLVFIKDTEWAMPHRIGDTSYVIQRTTNEDGVDWMNAHMFEEDEEALQWLVDEGHLPTPPKAEDSVSAWLMGEVANG